jgi:hypothetical protein
LNCYSEEKIYISKKSCRICISRLKLGVACKILLGWACSLTVDGAIGLQQGAYVSCTEDWHASYRSTGQEGYQSSARGEDIVQVNCPSMEDINNLSASVLTWQLIKYFSLNKVNFFSVEPVKMLTN